jgi:hypothetical protein
MLESVIEAYLRDQVKKIGGRAFKWVSPSTRHVPDRIVLLPKGRVVFVETKATGAKPSAGQIAMHRKLRALGFTVLVIDSKAGVDEFVLTNE